MNTEIAAGTAKLVKALVAVLAEKGTRHDLDQAREIVEQVRIACDESTALINHVARKLKP